MLLLIWLQFHLLLMEMLVLLVREEIEITKRKRVIARLLPVTTAPPKTWPDFQARLRKIYGDKVLKVTGAELVAQERDRY